MCSKRQMHFGNPVSLAAITWRLPIGMGHVTMLCPIGALERHLLMWRGWLCAQAMNASDGNKNRRKFLFIATHFPVVVSAIVKIHIP